MIFYPKVFFSFFASVQVSSWMEFIQVVRLKLNQIRGLEGSKLDFLC